MPGAKGAKGRVKRGAAPAWADEFTELCLPPPKPKPRRPKAKKRFHRAFRVLIALGLIPTKSRQCDPLGLRLNRMHVMDSDCEKTGACLAAESAPDLIKSSAADDASQDTLRDAKTPSDEAAVVVNGNHAADETVKEDDKVVEPSNVEETKGDEKSTEGCAEEETKEDEKEKTLDNKEEKASEEEKPMKGCEAEVPEKESSPPAAKETPVNMVVESEDTLKVNTEITPKNEKRENVAEEKEEVVPASEEDDRQSITSSHQSQGDTESRKRRGPKGGEADLSSGSESDSGRKKIKVEPDTEPIALDLHRDQTNAIEEGREKVIQDFVNDCSRTVEDINLASEKLQKELQSLDEMARAKEQEWNTILRVRKLKEEMLERLNRKKRVILLDDSIDRGTDPHNQKMKNSGSNQLMMVPIVSSSPSNISGRNVSSWKYDNSSCKPHHRQILPKPSYNQSMDPNSIVREGRNGPIKDVQSIIADFNLFSRSTGRNEAPKRFRRGRTDQQQNRMTANPALISMANMALGSGASVRTLDPYSPHVQDNSRSPSGDPTRGVPVSDGQGGVGFKDVLVQFAKMSQSPGKQHTPPPPYPEVTLHPVAGGPQSPPPTTTSSLLHGILTKPTNNPPQRPANFSPTLARLLVAPERPIRHTAPPPPYSRTQPSSQVSLTDILTSSKKSRNEITITPVSGNPNAKPKEDVVLLERYLSSTTRAKAYNSIPENILFKTLDDDDETGSGDRLVIDEGADGEEVPQCQGCRQKSAQFVCAGCGNQWYCSRECQVAAWEEHSEMCSE